MSNHEQSRDETQQPREERLEEQRHEGGFTVNVYNSGRVTRYFGDGPSEQTSAPRPGWEWEPEPSAETSEPSNTFGPISPSATGTWPSQSGIGNGTPEPLGPDTRLGGRPPLGTPEE